MEKKILARASFIPLSPRKLRLVADSVRGLPLDSAVQRLKLLPQAAAAEILAVFNQAIANAKNNFSLSPQDLSIESLQIHAGPRRKRRDVHAHGARFSSGLRQKQLSHITLELKAKYGSQS